MSDAFEIVMEAVPSVHVSTLLEEMGRMAESVSVDRVGRRPHRGWRALCRTFP